MTSHVTETTHSSDLKQLLLDSGVVCVRSAVVSEDTSETIEEVERDVPSKVTEEEHIEAEIEEEISFPLEVVEEELPEIFPTPSLRIVLSDRIRTIQKHNRIHVLPDTFRMDIDPLMIPRISNTPAQKYISELADITGCKSYQSSLAEFWFLDTLANLLRRAQEDFLDKSTQATLIQWFCEWMKEMQNFDAATRPRMLKRFKDNMHLAAGHVIRYNRLPAPSDVGVVYEAVDNLNETNVPVTPADSKHIVTFEEFHCHLSDLIKILHYIYDLFSSDFQYDLVRSVFTFSPEYQLIDAPYQIQQPRRLYAPLKARAKEKTVKKDKEQKAGKGKKKEVDTEEYLHLLQLQSEIEREKEEELERDREDWNRRSHVLPLAFAISDEFFDKYWPPPTPEEEPPPEPEVKKKGKKK